MSARPWMKFYPSDWRSDPSLRMCSLAARGLWMEMIALMHEANPRGSLLVNGKPVTTRQLASLCGCTEPQATTLLTELREAGVYSVDDQGTVYSRRIRRDEKRAAEDKANGAKGGNPTLKGGVNPPDKAQWPLASSSGSSSSSCQEEESLRGTLKGAHHLRAVGGRS